jgi:hypothetical protein
MGLREAKKYITELHRKQGNPYLWPDFVTGLPDTSAIVKKTGEVYPKLGKYAVSFIRIANIHPYLVKYGPGRHSEIIQWAAAVLKTTMDEHKGFVGALGSHDFVAVCRAGRTEDFLREASATFEKKINTFYSKEDLERKTIMSFKKGNRTINIGLMRLLHATANGSTRIPEESLIPHLAKLCSDMETR